MFSVKIYVSKIPSKIVHMLRSLQKLVVARARLHEMRHYSFVWFYPFCMHVCVYARENQLFTCACETIMLYANTL
jgi:hypothetical protein